MLNAYRGSRQETGDYFDDLTGDNNSNDAGILGGSGLAAYDRVQEKLTTEGIEITQLACRRCGNTANMTITWEELFYVSQNGPGRPLVLPQGWFKSDTNLDCFVMYPCPKCGAEEGFAVHFTPDEAKKRLMQAGNSGLISPTQVQTWASKMQSYAQGQR
jgi:hypothetical protein